MTISYFSRRATVILGVLLTAGCADESGREGWGGSVSFLDNGAELIQNPAEGIWSAEETWRLTEDLRIGSVDGTGPDVFSELSSLSLAVGEDGRMFVLDGRASEVRVFDSSGAHVQNFGGPGEGPGEFANATIAGWGPDGLLWFADQRGNRYSAFSSDGEFVGSYPRTSSYGMYPWPGVMDSSGRVMDVGIRPTGSGEPVLVRVSPMDGVADTVLLPYARGERFEVLNERGMPSMSAAVPFAGQWVWRFDRNGYIWSAITDRYQIVQLGVEGDTVRIIERAAEARPVTAEERSAALENLTFFVEAGGTIDASRVPSTKPYLNGFIADDRGNLWVSVQSDGESSSFDIFDPGGRYLGAVTVPFQLYLAPTSPVFKDGLVHGFTRDDLGVPYLVRLRIETSGQDAPM